MKTIKKESFRLIVLIVSLIAFTGCANAQDSNKIKKMIADGAYLVDVRTPEEFAQGHVSGSHNIPVDEVDKNLEEFKDKKNIIVFCKSGARAARAKKILEDNGIKNITNGGSWEDISKLINNK